MQVDALHRKWYLFGDSLAAIETGFTSTLKTILGDRFNFSAQGGMQYNATNVPSGYYAFTTMLDTWLPSIANKGTYTDIIVELGSNDVVNYNATNLASGFSAAINKIHSSFPNAIIHIGIIGKQMTNETWWNNRRGVIQCFKRWCCSSNRNYLTWIDGNDNILGLKNQCFDGIHPVESGHTQIASALLSYMNGGGCIQFTTIKHTVTSGLQGLEVDEWYDSGKYFIQVRGTISNSSGFKIPAKLGTIGTLIGTCALSWCHREVQVPGFLQASLSIFGTEITHQIPCTIAFVPSSSGDNYNCTAYLVASYQDYYRDNSGNTVAWTNGFTFTSGIFNGTITCIDA